MKTRNPFLAPLLLLMAAMFVVGAVTAADGWNGSNQQTFSFDTTSAMTARKGVSPGMIAQVTNAGALGKTFYVNAPASVFAVNPPFVVAGQDNTVWVSDAARAAIPPATALPLVGSATPGVVSAMGTPYRVAMTADGVSQFWGLIDPNYVDAIDWSSIYNNPTSIAGYEITDAVSITDARLADDRPCYAMRTTTGLVNVSQSPAPIAGQVCMATDATHCVWQTPPTVGFGAPSGLVPGAANSAGVLTVAARADHRHAVPISTSETATALVAANDPRLKDLRTASGLAYAGGVVPISTGTAPSHGDVMTYDSSAGAGLWKPTATPADATTTSKGIVQLAGDLCGSAQSVGVCRVNGSSFPTGGSLTAGMVPVATGANAFAYQYLTDSSIAGNASLAPSKLAVGPANCVVASNGTTMNCYTFTVGMHGTLTGGHTLANTTQPGFVTSLGSVPGTFLGTDGSGNQLFQKVPWASLTGYPTITAIAPLHVNGTTSVSLGNLSSIGVVAASASNGGYMSSTHYSKLEGIANAVTGQNGYLLTPSSSVNGAYVLVHPSSLDLVGGSGTPGRIARFVGGGELVSDSRIVDTGSNAVVVEAPLQSRNHSLVSTFGTAQWVRVGTFTAAQTGQTVRVVAYVHQGYNAQNAQDTTLYVTFKTSNGTGDANGFAGNGSYYAIGENTWFETDGRVKWKANAAGGAATAFDLYLYLPTYADGSHYVATVSSAASWTEAGLSSQVDPGAASSTVLVAPRSMRLAGLNGLTLSAVNASQQFVSIAVSPVTGDPSPPYFLIEAPSATDSNWSFDSGVLALNAGTNGVGSTGKIRFGYRGAIGAWGEIDSVNGAQFSSVVGVPTVRAATVVECRASSARHTLGRPAGFEIDEEVFWATVTTGLASPGFVNIDFGDSVFFQNTRQYHVDAIIMAAGAIARTFRYTGTWTKSSGVLNNAGDYNSFGNGAGLSVGAGSPNNNTARIVVGAPTGTIKWTAKITVFRVPLP